MVMNNLIFEGTSKNLRYVFTNKGIYDFLDDKTYGYTMETFKTKGLTMLKEISEIDYKLGKINLDEYTSSPRKTLYNLTEIFQFDNSIKLIKEWEEKFGNDLLLINESVDRLIIEERVIKAWNGITQLLEQFTDWLGKKLSSGYETLKSRVKDTGDFLSSPINYVGDKLKKGWKWVKEKAMDAWKCLSDNFVECLMEGLRSAVLSPVGVAVEVFLTVTGVAAPVVMVIYGVLLLWDVYLLFSDYEKFSWLNLLIDIIGIVTSGVGVPIARAAFKGISTSVKSSGKSFSVIAQKIIPEGGTLSKILISLSEKISKFGSKILNFINQGAQWVSKNFKINFLKEWVGKASSMLDNIKNSIDSVISGGKNVSNTNKLSTGFRKGIKAGSADYGVTKGVEAYGEYKSDKMNSDISNAIADVSNISADDAMEAGLY